MLRTLALKLRRLPARSARLLARVAGAAIVVGVTAFTTLATYAAFSGNAGNSGNNATAGTVKLTDNDTGAMLGLTDAALGATDTSCIRATSEGSLASQVRHYATVTGNVAPYLTLKVTRGTGAAGFDNCTGFAADSANYYGDGQGVIFDDKLSLYPATYAAGLVDPSNTGGVPTYSGDVLATAGLVDYWRLGESSGTVADESNGNNDGTYVNAPTLGAAGALSGDGNTAVTFDGVSDHVTMARQVSGNFSIEFFFKSTQGIGTGAGWFNGAGMVDANTTGANNDFGTSLRSDGRVVAGTGGPEVSIVSTTGGFNDGAWHHVVFTRTQSTGALALYVDGNPEGTATGGTLALTTAPNFNLGRLQNGVNYFAGTLDEVAIYDAALSAATVSSHYAASSNGGPIVPETWTNTEQHWYRFQVTVDNDVAANGKSGAATFLWEARNQ